MQVVAQQPALTASPSNRRYPCLGHSSCKRPYAQVLIVSGVLLLASHSQQSNCQSREFSQATLDAILCRGALVFTIVPHAGHDWVAMPSTTYAMKNVGAETHFCKQDKRPSHSLKDVLLQPCLHNRLSKKSLTWDSWPVVCGPCLLCTPP